MKRLKGWKEKMLLTTNCAIMMWLIYTDKEMLKTFLLLKKMLHPIRKLLYRIGEEPNKEMLKTFLLLKKMLQPIRKLLYRIGEEPNKEMLKTFLLLKKMLHP